ncbi:MAG: FMN-binding protein [Planctomycetaceae bacterium]
MNVHHWRTQRDTKAQSDWSDLLPRIQQIHPLAVSCKALTSSADAPADTVQLLNATGQEAGTAIRTSPFCDHLVGFSGPTNVLMVFDAQGALLGFAILSSGDTKEHVSRVAEDRMFFQQLVGQTPEQLSQMKNVDSVTGATLTSLSILEAVRLRCRMVDPQTSENPASPAITSLRFPDPPRLQDVKRLYADAISCDPDAGSTQTWIVRNAEGKQLGFCLRLSPAADNQIGYQGPTDALVAFDENDQVTGVAIGVSFDNEPYVGYVRDDRGFRRLWNGRSIADLAGEGASRVEGVSGATMTSQSVAQAVQIAAQALLDERRKDQDHSKRVTSSTSSANGADSASAKSAEDSAESSSVGRRVLRAFSEYRAISTSIIVLCGVVLGVTHLRSRRWLRRLYQCVVILWLGWMNADFLSQAQLTGWALHGIPWERAMGQVMLTLAAIAVPVFRGQNIYCSHICPHGAVQQVIRNRLPWQIRLPSRLSRWLKAVPVVLLLVVVLAAFGLLELRAVDLEPFDAWVWRISGLAALTIAIAGLTASLFLPMGYCRFGCPTGAFLDWLATRSDRWSIADTLGSLVLFLCVLFVFLD